MGSPREEVQHELAEILAMLGLNDSYGIIEGKHKDQKSGKTYRSLTFCKARILDGTIKIYSPTFILVKWNTSIRNLPKEGQERCKSVQEVKAFLQNNFFFG